MRTDRLLLDTHVWARFQGSPEDLRPAAAEAISEAEVRDAVFVSVISVWELAMLERSGKVALEGGVRLWVDRALSKPGIRLLAYSPEIAIEAVQLPEPMHKDPADRVLVACSRVEELTLVTADRAILQFAKTIGLSTLRA